jgi:hypothetical protein
MQDTNHNNPDPTGELPGKSGPPAEVPYLASLRKLLPKSANPPKAKPIQLIPEGVNQADIDAVLKRLALMRKRLREDILFVGGRLARMRDQTVHGEWTKFVERTFPLSVKTANIWIRAYENRESELAVSDWDAYMRLLYGNEAKKLKAAKEQRQEKDDDDDDNNNNNNKQHGGFKFNPGFFLDPDNPDKLVIADGAFEDLVGDLDRDIFGNEAVMPKEKLRFIAELIRWLEIWRTKIAARAEEKETE